MTGSISPNLPSKGEPLGTSDNKLRGSLITLRDGLNAILGGENKVSPEGLEKAAKPVTWYEPKVIATEETRENTAYGTLSTADEITGVVVPSNALVRVGYAALWKVSTGAAVGAVSIFFGTQEGLSPFGGSTSAGTSGTSFTSVATKGALLENGATNSSWAARAYGLSPIDFFVPAGTYAISVRYKASTGTVTAKERKLWVEVHGF